MKKIYSLLLVAITAVFALSSCNRELDVQTAYPFEVSRMPIPKDIQQGETIEIRCHLSNKGEFAGTQYRMRYFQYDGKGSLHQFTKDATPLVPNDYYAIPKGAFRLYYTSQTSERQTLEIVFEDNHGQTQIMKIEFNNKREEDKR